MRVLVAEDEVSVARNIAAAIGRQGYVADVVHDGEEAWYRGSTENYGLIVLDLGLPKLDGLSVLRRWRSEGRTSPVIVLSARSSWAERVEGIDAGADDYLPKPFEMEELLARMRAVLRRTSGTNSTTLDVGAIRLDLKAGTATINGIPLTMTPLEFRLLKHLALNAGRPVSKDELADELYDFNHERDANAVEAIVSRLRRKMGKDVIQSKRGFGYCLASSNS